jgi:ribosomal-protein-alanine N-acetyltransferase
MEIADLPLVKRLDDLVFDDNAWDERSLKTHIQSRDNHLFVVLYDDENPDLILGYGGISSLGAGAALVNLVAIHPDLQGRKIGRYLMKILTDWAATKEISRIFLQTKLDNIGAQKMYSDLGFKRVGTLHGYYGNTGEDALLWRLSQA